MKTGTKGFLIDERAAALAKKFEECGFPVPKNERFGFPAKIVETMETFGRILSSMNENVAHSFVESRFAELAKIDSVNEGVPVAENAYDLETAILEYVRASGRGARGLFESERDARNLFAGAGLLSGFLDGMSAGVRPLFRSGFTATMAGDAAETKCTDTLVQMRRIVPDERMEAFVFGVANSAAVIDAGFARSVAEALPETRSDPWLLRRGHFDLAAEFGCATGDMTLLDLASGIPGEEWIRANSGRITEEKLDSMAEGFRVAVSALPRSAAERDSEENSSLETGAGKVASALAVLSFASPDMVESYARFANRCALAMGERFEAKGTRRAIRVSMLRSMRVASEEAVRKGVSSKDAAIEKAAFTAASMTVSGFISAFAGDGFLRSFSAAGAKGRDFDVSKCAGDFMYASDDPFIFGGSDAAAPAVELGARLSARFIPGGVPPTGLDRSPFRIIAPMIERGALSPDVLRIFTDAMPGMSILSKIAAFSPSLLTRTSGDIVPGTKMSGADVTRLFKEGLERAESSDAARANLLDLLMVSLAVSPKGNRGEIFECAVSKRPDILAEEFLNSTHPGFGAPCLFVLALCLEGMGMKDAVKSLVSKFLKRKTCPPFEKRIPTLLLGAALGHDVSRLVPSDASAAPLDEGTLGSMGALWRGPLRDGCEKKEQVWKMFEETAKRPPTLGDALLLMSPFKYAKSLAKRPDLWKSGVRRATLAPEHLLKHADSSADGEGFVSAEAVRAASKTQGRFMREEIVAGIYSSEEKKRLVRACVVPHSEVDSNVPLACFIDMFGAAPATVFTSVGFRPDDPLYWCDGNTANVRHPMSALLSLRTAGTNVSETASRLASFFERDARYWELLFRERTPMTEKWSVSNFRGSGFVPFPSSRDIRFLHDFLLLDAPALFADETPERRRELLAHVASNAAAMNILVRPKNPESASLFIFGVSAVVGRFSGYALSRGRALEDDNGSPMGLGRISRVSEGTIIDALLSDHVLDILYGKTDSGFSEETTRRLAGELARFAFFTLEAGRFADTFVERVQSGDERMLSFAAACVSSFEFEADDFGYAPGKAKVLRMLFDREAPEEADDAFSAISLFERGSGRFEEFVGRVAGAIARARSEMEEKSGWEEPDL